MLNLKKATVIRSKKQQQMLDLNLRN